MSEKTLENLDLNLLLALHWLLTERNVTEASKRLNLSQPATSRALGRLRDLFEDPLLVKSGRVMLPTPTAEGLQPKIAEAIDQLRGVMNVSHQFDPATQKGRFRIASKDVTSTIVVKAWTNVIAPYAPGLDLDFVDLSFAITNDLISGKIDLVIVPEFVMEKAPPGVDLEQFVRKPLFKHKYKSCLRRNHPMASKKMTMKEFAALDHILVTPDNTERGELDDVLEEHGLTRRIAYRTNNFLMALPIVSYTDCILTTTASAFDYLPEDLIVFDPPFDSIEIGMGAGWHPNWTYDARHKWVRERLFAEISKLAEAQYH
jgi:DNA-binding transcriptional LysR family regulator